MTGWRSAAAVWYWSLSTPIASAFFGLRGLEDAGAGAAGRGEDDVRPGVVHAVRGLGARRRVVEALAVRRVGQVLDLDLDVRLDGLGAGREARLELLQERDEAATDVADVARLALQGGRRADEERALVLGEDQAGHVRRTVDGRVDDAELGVRELRRDVLQRGGVEEADRDDGVVAGLREERQAGLLVGVRLTLGRRELLDLDTELGLGLVEARRGGVVERLVATTADVVGQADLERRRRSRSSRPGSRTRWL